MDDTVFRKYVQRIEEQLRNATPEKIKTYEAYEDALEATLVISTKLSNEDRKGDKGITIAALMLNILYRALCKKSNHKK
jgi:hypothetical protein